MLGEILAKRLVNGLGVSKHFRDVGLQEHDVRALAITFVVLATNSASKVVLYTHPSFAALSLFFFVDMTFCRGNLARADQPQTIVSVRVRDDDEPLTIRVVVRNRRSSCE